MKTSTTETLNIDYHTRLLLLRSLNRHRFKTSAFKALGVSEKQGYNLIKRFEVRYNGKEYYSDMVIEFRKLEVSNI